MASAAAEREKRAGEIAAPLVRLNAHLLGACFALLAGPALFLATIVLVLRGGEAVGQMLGLLSHFFPGYAVSVGGAFVGAFWAALFAYLMGFSVGRAFGPWLLGAATRHLSEGVAPASPNAQLGGRVIVSLRPLPFALVTASLLSFGLVAATSWLWWRYGGHPSPHLELLAHYLPGYSSDPVGSLRGAFWLFLYSAAGAFGVAWIYGVVARARSRAS